MKHRKRVYIAGPISRGPLLENVNNATAAFRDLMAAGFAPFCPHWSVYANGAYQHDYTRVMAEANVSGHGASYADWIAVDLPWVAASDALLRLPGESAGADMEVAEAERCGIPVYGSVGALIAGESGGPVPACASAGHPGYLKLLEDMAALHKKKAADYGSDRDPFANVRASQEIGIPAWKGAWLRAKDKVKRIDQFCIKAALANESVEDSLFDLAAYCLIALAIRREDQPAK